MIHRVLGGLGKVLITLGVLVLLFVAYQLWGTGLHEEHAQSKLRKQYDQLLGSGLADTNTTATTADPPTTRPSGTTTTLTPKVGAKRDIAPNIGDVVGQISIPRIHVHKIVVQGVSLTQLD